MENSVNPTNQAVIPEYTQVKSVILKQYYLSQISLSNYSQKPDRNNETEIRTWLFVLSQSLSLKTYVLDEKDLEEKKMKKYFQNFLSNPNLFTSFSIYAIFSVCHLILEKLGFFKVETETTQKENVYNET